MNLLVAVIIAHILSEFVFILIKNRKTNGEHAYMTEGILIHIPFVFISILLASLFYLPFTTALLKATLNILTHIMIDTTISKIDFKKFSFNKAYFIDETMHIVMLIIIYDPWFSL